MCLWWTTERVAFVSSSITRSTQHTRIGFFPFNSHISHLFLCSRTIRWSCRFSIGIREKTHHSQRTEQKEKCYGWKAATTAANILFHFSVACLATASRPRSIPPFVLVHKQNCTPFTPNARAKTERSRQCSILFSSPFLLGRIRPLSPRTPHHTKPLSLHTRFYSSRAPERIEFLRNRKRTTQQQKKKSVVVSLMPLHALCVAIYIPFPVLATCSWWRTMPPRCSSYPWSVYVCCHCPATSAPHFYFFVFSIGALVPTSAQIYRTGCACVLCGPTVVVAYHIDMLRAEHIAGHTMPHSSTAQLLSVYSTYRVIDW